jgi:hypothetical protein
MSISDSQSTSWPTIPPGSRLIVCERSGEWSVALRAELSDAGAIVWECRQLAEAWSALAEHQAAFLIVEATSSNLRELAERISWLRRDFPLARAAVVAEHGLAECEWLMREASAVHFLTSTRELPSLVPLVHRHLANVPRLPQSLAEEIWASLPWAGSKP